MKALQPTAIIAPLLRQFMFDAKVDGDMAMYFQVRLSMENYGYENDGNTNHQDWRRHYTSFLHIFVTRRYKVFIAVSQEMFLNDVDPTLFKNVSNHDSAWESAIGDAFRSEFGKAKEHCFDWMEENLEAKPHAPRDWYDTLSATNCYVGQGLFQSNMVQFARLNIGEYIDDRNYLRHLNGWELLNHTVTIAPVETPAPGTELTCMVPLSETVKRPLSPQPEMGL
jgi:hypothetical protein